MVRRRALKRKLMRDLSRRKFSFFLLIGILIVGSGVYVGMSAVLLDLLTARDAYYRDYRLADFTVAMKRMPGDMLQKLAQLPGIRHVEGRISTGALLDIPGKSEPISGTALSAPANRKPMLNDLLLRTGTWFSDDLAPEVILNDAFARANGLKPGNRMKILLLDRQHDVLIVGTAMSPEYVYLISESGGGLAPDPERSGVLYMPQGFLQRSCDLDGAFNQVIGTVYDPSSSPLLNLLKLMEERLEPYGVTSTSPMAEQASTKFLADELRTLGVTSKLMPGLFLCIAALVLNLMMSRIVAQQRTVIGTLRAVGYSSGDIIRHYMGYGVIVGLAGALGGLVLGNWLQNQLVSIYSQFYALPQLEARIHIGPYLAGVAFCIFFSVVGTIHGAREGANLSPAAAMRPPPPESGHRILLERIGFFWKGLSFRWRMILRSVFRNPFRSSVSIFAAMIATSIILSTKAQQDALNYLMAYEFQQVSHQDITVALRDPRGSGAAREVASIASIARSEAQLVVACKLINGPYEKISSITGLEPGTDLYTPLDSNGNRVPIPQRGIVLSEKLAELLDVGIGDTLVAKPLIGTRKPVRVPVTAICSTYLGLPVYADLHYLSELIGEADAQSAVLANYVPGAPVDAVFERLKVMPSVLGFNERMRGFYQLEKTFGETMGAMTGMMIVFAAIIALGSVFNTAIVNLNERSREVATFRVLGYFPREVAAIFSWESILLNSVGIIAGIFFGVLLQWWISRAYDTELFRFPLVIRGARVVESAGIMMGFVLLAQLFVWRIVVKFGWLEALKVKE